MENAIPVKPEKKEKRKILYRVNEKGEYVLNWIGALLAIPMYFLYTLVIPLVTQAIMLSVYMAGNPDATREQAYEYLSSQGVTLNVITYVVSALMLFAVYGRFLWGSLKELFGNMTIGRGMKFLWVPLASIGGTYMLNMIAVIITNAIVGGTDSVNQEMVTDYVFQMPWAMIFLTVIMAPLVEEPIFRGAFFRPMWFKSKALAIIVTLVLFALHHVWSAALSADTLQAGLEELVYMITYIPAGVATVFGYCMFRNIYGAMLSHMAINGFSVTMMLLLQLLTEAVSQSGASTEAVTQSVGLITRLAAEIVM